MWTPRLDELLELVLTSHAAVEKAPRTFDAEAHHAAGPPARQRRAWSCSKTRAVCFL